MSENVWLSAAFASSRLAGVDGGADGLQAGPQLRPQLAIVRGALEGLAVRFHRRSVSSCHSESSLPGRVPLESARSTGQKHQSIAPGPAGLVAALLHAPQAAALSRGRAWRRGLCGAAGPARRSRSSSACSSGDGGGVCPRRAAGPRPSGCAARRGRRRRTRWRRPSVRVISMTSPGLTSRCGLADWPLTSTLPPLTRPLRLRARLEQTRDVEPDVETEGTDLFSTESSVRGRQVACRDLSPYARFCGKRPVPVHLRMTRSPVGDRSPRAASRRRGARAQAQPAHHHAAASSSATTSATTTSSPTTSRSPPTGRSSRSESDRIVVQIDRQDRRGPRRSSWRSSRRRRTTRISRATRTSPRRLAHAEGLTDDAGARAREGGQGRRLDRRRAARHRDARRAAARRDGLPDGEPHRRRDDADSRTTSSSCSCTRIRTATISSPTGTCAIPIRSSARSTACRGSTRSTSATTTTATSSRRRRPRPRT